MDTTPEKGLNTSRDEAFNKSTPTLALGVAEVSLDLLVDYFMYLLHTEYCWSERVSRGERKK